MPREAVQPTDDGATAAIGLLMPIVAADVAFRLYRRRTRIHVPAAVR